MKKRLIVYSLLLYYASLPAGEKEVSPSTPETLCNQLKNSFMRAAVAVFNVSDACLRIPLEVRFGSEGAERFICGCRVATLGCCCYCCQGPIMTPAMVAATVVAGYESGVLVPQPRLDNSKKSK